jgi:hypothetical protein
LGVGGLEACKKLELVRIHNCRQLLEVDFRSCPCLRHVEVTDCRNELKGVDLLRAPALQTLDLAQCHGLQAR